MPTPGAIANRRLAVYIVIAAGMLAFLWIFVTPPDTTASYLRTPIHHVDVDKTTLHGDVIMPTLGNETLKYEF